MENASDLDNPYDIGANENTSATITIEKLNINNYQTWEIQMKSALDAKNKFGFVDGTILITGWLLCNMENDISKLFMNQRQASTLWEILKKDMTKQMTLGTTMPKGN